MDQRRDQVMEIQQPISLKQNQKSIGKIVDVLIEQENPETQKLVGRSARFSPDVDGLVYVEGSARLGSIIPVHITDADIYDQYGYVVQEPFKVI
jgi:ribosomal protein S12 methylthiotransferase